MNILLIGSQTDIRTYIKNLILNEGFTCYESGDWEGTQSIIEAKDLSFIIIDAQMIGNGFSIAERIKKYYPHIHIIIISDIDDSHFRKKAVKTGALELVSKENLLDIKRIIHRTEGV